MSAMKLQRFYLAQDIPQVGELIIAEADLVHQLANVFRYQAGDRANLFNGSGDEFVAEIISLSRREVKFKILECHHRVTNQGSAFGNSKSLALVNPVSLYLAVIKKDNFEWAAEKSTEIGVAEIHPVLTARSEKKELNGERLQKIVKEASEQSGRVTLPSVFPVTDLAVAVLQVVKEGKQGVVFHTVTDSEIEVGHNRPGHQTDHPALTKAGIDGCHPVAAFVGPEGGFTETEIELFRKNNFEIRSLGQNILRAETAAIIAVYSLLK